MKSQRKRCNILTTQFTVFTGSTCVFHPEPRYHKFTTFVAPVRSKSLRKKFGFRPDRGCLPKVIFPSLRTKVTSSGFFRLAGTWAMQSVVARADHSRNVCARWRVEILSCASATGDSAARRRQGAPHPPTVTASLANCRAPTCCCQLASACHPLHVASQAASRGRGPLRAAVRKRKAQVARVNRDD